MKGTLVLLGSLFTLNDVFILDTKLKHLPFDLDNGSYKVNAFITIVPESMVFNGTGRLEYLISIPKWSWSISVAKGNCPEFYWQDNLRGKIDNCLEKYIQELSHVLSRIHINLLFEE